MKDESGVQAHKHTDATPLRGIASGVCVCVWAHYSWWGHMENKQC